MRRAVESRYRSAMRSRTTSCFWCLQGGEREENARFPLPVGSTSPTAPAGRRRKCLSRSDTARRTGLKMGGQERLETDALSVFRQEGAGARSPSLDIRRRAHLGGLESWPPGPSLDGSVHISSKEGAPACPAPSVSSPASGPICLSRFSPARRRSSATKGSSSPAGATTSTSTRRSRTTGIAASSGTC